MSDEYQERLGRKMQQLTGGDRSVPVVAMGWNAERFQGRNLALRLVALGYTDVYWYRGGREAWEVGGPSGDRTDGAGLVGTRTSASLRTDQPPVGGRTRPPAS